MTNDPHLGDGSLAPNPMICRSGLPLHWRASEDNGLWFAELGITGQLSGKLRWERVGESADNQDFALSLARNFALDRAGRL